jgi:hypothetical protein
VLTRDRHSAIGNPIVFLSHSSQDKPIVRSLTERLLQKVYPGTGFTSGSTSELTEGQLISPYNDAALADGIFVG